MKAYIQRVVAASRRCNREDGQTLLEYALIVGFIGIGTIAVMVLLGPAIGAAFQVVTDTLTGISF